MEREQQDTGLKNGERTTRSTQRGRRQNNTLQGNRMERERTTRYRVTEWRENNSWLRVFEDIDGVS